MLIIGFLTLVAFQPDLLAKKMVKPTEIAVYHNNVGVKYLDAGDLELAEVEFKTAAELCPDYVEAYNNLGVIAKKRGDLKSAKVYFEKAIALDKKYGAAYSHLSMVLLDEGDLEKALEAGKMAVKRGATMPLTHYNLALVYLEMTKRSPDKNYDQFTEQQLKITTELDPMMFEAHRALARVYKKQGKLELASIRYRLALESHPVDAEIWKELGDTYIAMGDSVKAENAFRKAASVAGEAGAEQLPQPYLGSTNTNMDIGLKYMGQKDYLKAIEEFNAAAQVDPKNELAFYRIGTAYIYLADQKMAENKNSEAAQDYKNAEAPLLKALSLNPQMADASYNLGLVYYKLGNHSAAQTQWEGTISIYSKHTRALYNLGMLYNKQGMKEKSVDYFCRFLSLAGNEFASEKVNAQKIIDASGGKCQN